MFTFYIFQTLLIFYCANLDKKEGNKENNEEIYFIVRSEYKWEAIVSKFRKIMNRKPTRKTLWIFSVEIHFVMFAERI